MAALNAAGAVRRYPGSPLADRRRRCGHGDRYLACELRPDEHDGAAATLMKGRRERPHALRRRLCGGGGAGARATGRVLVLIDPPFEQPDDYRRIVETLAAVRRRNPHAQALVWLPLKDLETFDGFLRDLEDAVPGAGCWWPRRGCGR